MLSSTMPVHNLSQQQEPTQSFRNQQQRLGDLSLKSLRHSVDGNRQ